MSSWVNGNLQGRLSIGQGERGKSLEYEWRGTELGIRQEGEEEYQFVNLVSGADGQDGREIELQVGNGYIQWRYKGEEEWNNLISIDSLKGGKGDKGEQGERGPQGEQGPKGETGPQGPIGEQGLQGLPGKDGKNGLDGTNGQDGADGVTPNITIGTVTTLEAGQQATVVKRGTIENPIFDFGIPKGENGSNGADGATPDMTEFEKKINEQYDNIDTKVKDVDKRVQVIEQNGVGGGNANIDDNTISKTSTWSSEKIEDFVHTNDDVVWSTVQGENLSIDYTKEGYLREVEIWGNTIQGFADCVTNKQIVDSILSTGLDDSAKINDDGTFTITYAVFGSTTDWSTINKEGFIQLEPNTKYSVGCWRNNGTFPNVYYILYEEMGIKGANGYAIPTFTTGASGKVLLYPASAQSGKLNLRVVKGGYKLTNYPYDFNLGHIQHLGELYVDEKGQPILDSEGREQYKVEIGSAFGLNLANTIIPQYQAFQDGTTLKTESGYRFTNIKDSKGSNIKFNMSCDTSKTYTIQMDIASNTMVNSSLKFLRHTAYTPIATVSGGSIQRVKFKLQPYATDILFYLNITPIVENQYVEIENIIIFEGDYTNFEYDIEDTTQHKTTLLLPCQLSKVGDISDRLYWDSEKKKYVVEKNIGVHVLDGNESEVYNKNWAAGGTAYPVNSPQLESKSNYLICNRLKMGVNWGELEKYGERITLRLNSGNIYNLVITLSNEKTNGANNITGLRDWLKNNNLNIFYQLATPQLIETNITEQILLPCYKDKTHLFVTGGLDGTIKAKAPLDGGQAIQSLSARNVALSLENEELKETNDTQDILINTTMLATDEMYMMLEPLLAETLGERSVSKMVDMYVAMVQRGIKTIEQVPIRYREQVKKILDQLEK